ncbi:PLP-dependent aminotransferase family protein [Corynebacterium phoceense]|uniref:MocR-like pyridoxine biosynthesis transcription factor PdxR n=1 Tax=Corynebacterium phoceense TaxID=1686286 RepID=UPI0034CD1971
MHVILDPADTRTLPVQLAHAIRGQISARILSPGEALPSTRQLAAELGISRGSVVAAYDQLLAEGYLEATVGSGTHVSRRLHHNPVSPAPEPAIQKPARALVELTPGAPDTAGIITPEWRSAWRRAASTPLSDAPASGLPALRHEVAAHLGTMRGLAVDPARILITSGAREGLALLLRALAPALGGALTVGVESPGYPSLRRIPSAFGHAVAEIPTDSEGVRVPATPLDALIVTPSHQYPYGESLSAARRTKLVAWARRTDALLIEDDFDSELRYAGQPLPALTALEPARTALLGTFSSVISPGVACGYLVAPSSLVPRLRAERELTGQPVSLITQSALARYLASGALRRHTGSVRRAYRRRRDLVDSYLGDLPGTQLLPIRGGLHAVLLCEKPADEVVAAAGRLGVGLTALAEYWGGKDAPGGVVLGFGHLADSELDAALRVVATAARL